MRECPDSDAIVSIADALDWEVAEGLQHLQTCADCRARIATLQAARSALLDAQPVEALVLDRITDALSEAAHHERVRARRTQRWASVAEAVLAGAAAPVVLVSGGVQIGSMAAVLLTGALGSAFVVYGRRLRLYA